MKRHIAALCAAFVIACHGGTANQPPSVAVTTPAQGAIITSLPAIGGTAGDDVAVTGVTFSLREDGIPGSAHRWWNGAAWQGTQHLFDATLAGATWSASGSFVFPPLNSGRSFTIEAQAMDAGATSSTVAAQSFTATTTSLSWDNGATAAGAVAITQPNDLGGDYYFKVVTQNVSAGGWRTALNVTGGEADVYLKKGALPTPSDFQFGSSRTGSDGFVVHSSQFAPSEEWYILVRATAGSQWRLVTGEVNVQNLGTLAADASSGSGAVTIGAEGMKFFHTAIPGNTLAWRIWLNGDGRNLLVKKADIAHPASYDLQQAAQMLVVPPYLTSGDYFVTVSGNPGDSINLDSRQQAVTDINFTSTTSLNVTGYGYTTYRVQVPIQQIAWETTVTPASGDANLAIRRSDVPNEFFNTAYSQVPGNVTDSVTLVPETLTDGTFYITVYGSGPHNFTLTSGNPVIDTISFTSSTLNIAPHTTKVGWRYFKIVDTEQQLGSLGWELFLQNQPVGTELAIRRNAVPGRWVAASSPYGGYAIDQSSTDGYLQRPGHQADVYYIGVYNAETPLGAFTLQTRPLTAATVSFNGAGSTASINNQPANRFQYFKVEVPAGVLGWNLRLKNVTGLPRVVVRRDGLPENLGTTGSFGLHASTWPTGTQFVPGTDWTGFSEDAGGVNRTSQMLVATMGYPLEPGTYYIGIIAYPGADGTLSYTLESRGIGAGQAITVSDLDFATGNVTVNALDEREAAYYRVTVPENTASWKIRLTPTSGDVLLLVNKDLPPNQDTGRHGYSSQPQNARVEKPGKEHYVILPDYGETTIPAGTYYLAVVSQGVNPSSPLSGTGNAAFTLESLGTMPVTDIGTLGTLNDPDLMVSGIVEAGEFKTYSLTVPTSTLVMEAQLQITSGSPTLMVNAGTAVPAPTRIDYYGVHGGVGYLFSLPRYDLALLDTLANPTPGKFTFTVKGDRPFGGGEPQDSSYTVKFRATEPGPVAFDGGTTNVTLHPGGTWRYYRIAVPNDANLKGWDLHLENVTAGDPVMFVRRDLLPDGSYTTPVGTWPSGTQVAAGSDFTRLGSDAGGVYVVGRSLTVGMGSPLEPGIYYVGVKSYSSSKDMAYSLVSRGLGSGFAIPVQTIAFTGGSASINNLAPRQAAFFKVTIPASTPSWKVKLATTTGESRMVWFRDALPSTVDYYNTRYLAKTGDEYQTLVPPYGQEFITPGDYYLAVVSEGVDPDYQTGTIGSGTSSSTLQSIGTMQVTNLGMLGVGGIVQAVSQAYGDTLAYEFTVPQGTPAFTVHLENTTGNPKATFFAGGTAFPYLLNFEDNYGYEGGSGYGVAVTSSQSATFPNPVTTYRFIMRANAIDYYTRPDASYTIRIQPKGYQDVTFRDGSASVTGQLDGEWRFFRFVVPTGIEGWNLRLSGVTGNAPLIYVRRDLLPDAVSSGVGAAETSWPSGGQFTFPTEWTGRSYSASGQYVYGQDLVLAMGRPLEPGIYFVGVQGSSGGTFDYTLTSRAIGQGETIPVNTLDFATGNAAISGLNPRDVAWYKVTIPENATSWNLRLAASSGESMMVINKDSLPSGSTGTRVTKNGNEHFLYLQQPYVGLVSGATYYIGVVSEGVNPTDAYHYGAGSVSASIESKGELPVLNLGVVDAGVNTHPDTQEGGEIKAFRFTIPEGAVNVEVKLEDRTGDPVMVLAPGSTVPNPQYGYAGSLVYGSLGGGTPTATDSSIFNLSNPYPGDYTLVVRAKGDGAAIPDASYTIRLTQPPIPALNFDASQNGGGGSNAGMGSVANGEKQFYRVVIPDMLNGQPVIGWRLDLNAIQGSPQLRYRKDYLPDNYGGSYSGYVGSTIVAPPVFSPGTWYIEISGSGTTTYELISTALVLQRPAWVMPVAGQSPNTPGLTPPFLGDTGVDPAGTALTGDQGTDLGQGDYHYYAVDVPDGNGALLRARLDAISGNPDLYVRIGSVPTLGTYDRSLTGTGTEYANWVPIDGKFEHQLAPGRWYLAVHAGGQSNVRYRLRLSTGNVQDLTLNGGSFANQTLTAGDWRYYRVQIPFNAPNNWNVTFSQIVGDVVMHVRDVVPPGQGQASIYYQDWASDYKNLGPYSSYDPPGAYTFTLPPLRPGSVYYLGFRAVSDATFSVSSTTSGGSLGTLPTIGFYNTTFNDTVPGSTARMYRIDVPADALRWKHTSTHSANLKFSLFAGTIPAQDQTPDWSSRQPYYPYDLLANASLNQPLYGAGWPWAPAQSFYLVVSNLTASAEPFSIVMSGRNADTEDADEDGLLDRWEIEHFGNIYSYGPNDDPDGDGMSNRLEYLAGTDPNDNKSYKPALNLTAVGGTLGVSPNQEYFDFNQQVQLTAMPDPGLTFIGWSGDVTGSQNPIMLTMNTSKYVTATFRVANDDFAHAEVITGTSTTRNASNTLATQEQDEPNHAVAYGTKSLWWSWTPTSSGQVTISTAGSSFDTVLAVYTGTDLAQLGWVASNNDYQGASTSQVQFTATPGTTYYIAVDGAYGSSGDIVLNLNVAQPPANDNFANRIVLSGLSAKGTSSTVNATFEETEVAHWVPSAGKSVWWSWTAPVTAQVTMTTVGSDFDTVMAVYTGNTLGTLQFLTSDDEGGGNHTSAVSFIAQAGTAYQIAVDGWGGASGNVTLNIDQGAPLALAAPSRLVNGQFQFTINGPNGSHWEVRASADLINWVTVIQSGTFNGTPVVVTDANASGQVRRFYKIVLVP